MGGGQPVEYSEQLSPEFKAFRKQLFNYLSPKIGQQIPSYPGTLPNTMQPDPAQLAGLNTIMQLLGYGGGYNWPGLTKKGYTTPGGLLNDGTTTETAAPSPEEVERKRKERADQYKAKR